MEFNKGVLLDLHQILKFYFITDENALDFPLFKQVEIAIIAGASVIQYRNKYFLPKDLKELESIRELCRTNSVPLIINDNIILAKAVAADGVHLGQTDEDVSTARNIMGPDAIIGISVSTIEELAKTDLTFADYFGTGPVFATNTKIDASPVIGLAGLKTVVERSTIPVVAIGGIDVSRVDDCFSQGAAGIAVISCITRAEDSLFEAKKLGRMCGCDPRVLRGGWNNEFGLIDKLIEKLTAGMTSADSVSSGSTSSGFTSFGFTSFGLKVPPGDDAALFETIPHPVITTDTQKENIHFRRDWQALDEIGQKAVEITFSDLAASYAQPISLFVNLSIPSYMPDPDIENLYSGIRRVLEKYQATLGGGNISSGREFSIDLFALGNGHPDIFPLRSNARPGDGLYVTGPLGMASAGLQCLKNGETGYPELIEKFKNPKARFDAAEILAKHNVTCVMDVSDGLAGDAGHIAAASNVSIRFELSAFITDLVLAKFCNKYSLNPEKIMLSGGEDYELMFACLPSVFEQIKKLLPESFQVGECISISGTRLMNIPADILSFQHGK
jgi:thiamine-monophosphate kinase